MPRCKICQKRVTAGIVMHDECCIDFSSKLMEIMCDEYCRYPREVEDNDVLLDEICADCKISRMLNVD